MDYRASFAISAAGMDLERARVEVAARNLANTHTTPVAGQPPYMPLRVVGVPHKKNVFASMLAPDGQAGARGPAFRIEDANLQPRMAYEPGHPHANSTGFVAYPGVDVTTEMVSFLSATRAYEANVAAMATARSLALKALDIGGNA